MHLKKKWVTCGWEGAMDTEAIEITPGMAIGGLLLIPKNPTVEDRWFLDTCKDVIKNSENQEITYLIAPFFSDFIENFKRLMRDYVDTKNTVE